MFDRGLVSVDDDYRIIAAKDGVPEQVRNLFSRTGKLIVPDEPNLRPHPHYLRFHRENVSALRRGVARHFHADANLDDAGGRPFHETLLFLACADRSELSATRSG